MFDNVFVVGSYVLILFILIGVGFVCNRAKILSRNTVKELTNFVLYIVTPCVIINSYMREFDKAMLGGLLITFAVAFCSFLLNIVISNILVKDKDKAREKTLRFGAIFSNCGYMSLPLQSVLLGDEGVFYGATYIVVFQIVVWTYGVILMSGSVKNVSLKKIILNPGIIGTLIGLVIFVFSLSVPNVIAQPIKYLAALNTPIPMMIVGFHLAGAKLSLKGASAYISIILRLVVLPMILLGGLYIFKVQGTVFLACIIAASAPSAANTTMFSEKFDADTPLSATVVSFTTLLSIITMPLIVGFATMLA